MFIKTHSANLASQGFCQLHEERQECVWRKVTISSPSTACHLTVCSFTARWKSLSSCSFKPIKVWRCITTQSLPVSHSALLLFRLQFTGLLKASKFYPFMSSCLFHNFCLSPSLSLSHSKKTVTAAQNILPSADLCRIASVPVNNYKSVWTYVTA